MWSGISLDTTKQDLVQSILEGVVFRIVNNFEIMNNFINLNKSISIGGGLIKNPYFVQFFADMMGKDISIPNSSELTSLGISMLAYKGLVGKDFPLVDFKKEIHRHNNVPKRKEFMKKFDKIVEKSRNTRTL